MKVVIGLEALLFMRLAQIIEVSKNKLNFFLLNLIAINKKLINMKKLSYIILGAILGVVGYYLYCNYICSHESESEQVMAIVKPKGLISPQQAKVLDTTYNKRYKLISDSIVTRSGGDNRSSWYALEDIQNYIKYADSQATSLGYTLNGLRIYAGAHEETSKFGPGYTTFFLIPTGTKNTAQGNSTFFNFIQPGGNDIDGGDGLNDGGLGQPPGANYPQ